MKTIEWAHGSLARYLTDNAPSTNAELQKASKEAKKAKNATFNANQDSYYIRLNKDEERYSFVIGWDHVVVLHRAEGGYVVECVMGYLGQHNTPSKKSEPVHPAYGDISGVLNTTNAPTRLTVDVTPEERLPDDSVWKVYLGLSGKILERVVTYGVSSCSFSLMFTADLEWIVISHISVAPIPVGHLMAVLAAGKETHFLASTFPQEDECLRFAGNDSLEAATHKLLLFRGKTPAHGSGHLQNPQLGHTDIGLDLTGDEPRLVGTLGLENDNEFSRLLPGPVLRRLSAFASPAGVSDSVLFECPYDFHTQLNLRAMSNIRARFADQGHPLSGLASVSADEDERSLSFLQMKPLTSSWTIEDRNPDKTIRAKTVVRQREVTSYSLKFKVQPANTEGTIDDPDGQFKGWLNARGVGLLTAVFGSKGVVFAPGASIVVNSQDRSWTITSGVSTIKVTAQTSTFNKPVTSLRMTSASEVKDIIREVITPMQNGSLGFAELHVAIKTAFLNRLASRNQSRPYLRLSWDSVHQFEVDLETGISDSISLSSSDKQLARLARLLGHYLSHGEASQDHPYLVTMKGVLQQFRYGFDLPLDAATLGQGATTW